MNNINSIYPKKYQENLKKYIPCSAQIGITLFFYKTRIIKSFFNNIISNFIKDNQKMFLFHPYLIFSHPDF